MIYNVIIKYFNGCLMRGNIRIDRKTGFAYIPKDVRNDGYEGDVATISNALTLTLIKPGVPIERAIKSLRIVLQDLQLQLEHQQGG